MARNTLATRAPRRFAALLGGTISTSLLLGACAGTGDSGGQIELRMVANITPIMTKEYYEDLVQPWLDENPGVTVTVEVPPENVQTTVQQQLASGDVADVIASYLQPVVAPQLLPFPEEDWVLETPFADENRVDGQIVSIGTSIQTQSLVYYNADAFAEAGITEVPATIDELTDALEAVQALGYLPMQTAGEWVTGNQFQALATTQLLFDDPDFWSAKTDGTASFADSAYQGYMDAYAEWVDKGLVASDALGFKYQDAIDNFTSGRAATIIMGNWLTPSIDAAAEFEVGVMRVPSLDGSDIGLTSGYAQPYSIMRDSDHVELSLSLVEYLVSDETAILKALAAEGNYRPGYSYDGTPLYNAISALIDAAPSISNHVSEAIPSGFGAEVNTAVQSLYTGTSPTDAIAALDAWWDANAVE